MNKILIAIALMVSAMFMGCTLASENSTEAWTQSDLKNLTIDLISDTKVEWMSFGPEGYVSVTAGQKDGPLTGPLFVWEIDKKGQLLIGEENGEWLYTIRKLKLTDSELVAEVNAEKGVSPYIVTFSACVDLSADLYRHLWRGR